jgi:hypothetical protein
MNDKEEIDMNVTHPGKPGEPIDPKYRPGAESPTAAQEPKEVDMNVTHPGKPGEPIDPKYRPSEDKK